MSKNDNPLSEICISREITLAFPLGAEEHKNVYIYLRAYIQTGVKIVIACNSVICLNLIIQSIFTMYFL